MEKTIEFNIPEGYVLDEENSTKDKIVFKQAPYEPKEGDLVHLYTGGPCTRQEFLVIYGCDKRKTPSVAKGWGLCSNWEFRADSIWSYDFAHAATHEDAALFTRILAENGYEYDPEKKEVRKKRWRAESREPYYYVNASGRICFYKENNDSIDQSLYDAGNYFRTREIAELAAKEIKEVFQKYSK